MNKKIIYFFFSLLIFIFFLIFLISLSNRHYKYVVKTSQITKNVLLIVKGDKVLKYIIYTESKYSKLNLESLKLIYKNNYSNIKGIKYVIEYDDLKQILKIYLDIDFTKVDLDELTSKRILLTKEVEYLSLSYVENLLLKEGYKKER